MKPWKWLVFLSAGCYLLSLIIVGIVPNPGANAHAETYGYECVFAGWLGFFSGRPELGIAWAANPAYLVLLALSLPRVKLRIHPAIGLIPFLLSLMSFGITVMVSDAEGGGVTPVHLGEGAYLWMLSLFLFAPVLVLKRKD